MKTSLILGILLSLFFLSFCSSEVDNQKVKKIAKISNCIDFCSKKSKEEKYNECVTWCESSKCKTNECLNMNKDVCLCCFIGTC